MNGVSLFLHAHFFPGGCNNVKADESIETCSCSTKYSTKSKVHEIRPILKVDETGSEKLFSKVLFEYISSVGRNSDFLLETDQNYDHPGCKIDHIQYVVEQNRPLDP